MNNTKRVRGREIAQRV